MFLVFKLESKIQIRPYFKLWYIFVLKLLT